MKKTIYTSLLYLLFVGCNSQQSLQKYMVENSENPNFIALDLGANILNMDNSGFSEEEKEALKSLKKLNILFLRQKTDNIDFYEQEKEKIQSIVKESSQYEQLLRIGNKGSKIGVYSVGSSDFSDEFLLLASDDGFGFLIVRMLGKKMNTEHIMNFVSILQKANIDSELMPLFNSLEKN